MEIIKRYLSVVEVWFPVLGTLAFGIAFILVMRVVMNRDGLASLSRGKTTWQLLYFAAFGALATAIILALPIDESARGDLLNFFGILITATIALSSTSFMGNAMSGLMIRSLQNFKPGDFIRVDGTFGRVSEMGLLHTEIQNENRNLITIPNLFLIQRPLEVIHSSGTIVHAEVSLGYDISQADIKASMIKAAEGIGLEDCFVQVRSLGDFSVLFRVSGFLKDVKYIISNQAKLKSSVIDQLHIDGIEIVSPTFMNQRVFDNRHAFISKEKQNKNTTTVETMPKEVVFDKAEDAQTKESLVRAADELVEKIQELEESLKDETNLKLKKHIEFDIEHHEKRHAKLIEILKNIEKK